MATVPILRKNRSRSMDNNTHATNYVAVDRGAGTDLAASLATQQAHDAVSGLTLSAEEKWKREKRRQKKWTVVIATVALTAFFIALAAIFIEGSVVAFLAFIFPVFVGPYVIHQRRKLNKLPTLRYVMNRIRNDVNTLMIENEKLSTENNRLGTEVQRLEQAEVRLEQVAAEAGSNARQICDLVKDNAETQRQMKRLQNAQEMQTFLTAVLQSDSDGNHKLTEQELNILLLRMKGISIADETKLRHAFMQTTSTTSLYKIAAASFTDELEESYDYTFGASNWLFDEDV